MLLREILMLPFLKKSRLCCCFFNAAEVERDIVEFFEAILDLEVVSDERVLLLPIR